VQQEGERNIKVILAKVGLSGGIYPLSLIRTCTIHAALRASLLRRAIWKTISDKRPMVFGRWADLGA